MTKKNLSLDAKRTVGFRRSLAALLAGCVLACSLAACGEDDDTGSSSSVSSGSDMAATISPSPTPQRTAKAAKVTGDVVNVRKTSSTDSDDNILGRVEEGDMLALLTDTAQDGWYQIQYQGSPAYVSADFVTVVDITIEMYNQLSAAATPTPSSSPSTDPGSASSSDDPAANQSSGASSASPSDNSEDGE